MPAVELPFIAPLSNLERILQSITPFVHDQYLSKKGWRPSDVEARPYFVLGDLWINFKEWNTYGVGVPLILNVCDSVVQYYVPYLSYIQIYGDSTKLSIKPRYLSVLIFLCI
ncbi:hypothetical protein PanWU01x14_133710 [Parasponia andersonii]|uniref:Uncharacterized protein n=1 Tax=Parasponia andersonii TaxID=3476 RepID=A0A2P5CPW8_PARAD|nr:hypothetical protein PanWU01x14_133710 [Parasponia andersonii]